MFAAVLALLGVALASRWRWVCDDAFISFRYAKNLVDGHGLVFNFGPGADVVEGYTNALWTVWIALGLAVGVTPELWSIVSGLAAYGALIFILARGAASPWLPLAAGLVAVSRPLQIWATGGLETAADLALLVWGWHLVTSNRDDDATRALPKRRAAVAGGVMALAVMTRPDSLLIAAITGLTVLLGAGKAGFKGRVPASAAFGGAFLALWLPFTAWRVVTYGDFFPNTYYAKSAQLWWLDQGLVYLGLFVRELPLFAVAPVLGGAALLMGRVAPERRARLASALAIALAFTLYVVKVGGGFMHTRLLLPALPFAWVVLEEAVVALRPQRATTAGAQTRRDRLVAGLALALCLIVALVPPALGPQESVRGVVDERAHYDPVRTARLERDAAVLRGFLAGLPVRAAYIGGQARLVYRTGVPIAVEAETGLTDGVIAHQPLTHRGRVGHEKHAPRSYLVETRRLHLVFGAFAFRYLGLEGYVPKVGVRLGHTTVFLVTWDAPLMAELQRRGAKVPPFEREAASLLADSTRIPAAQRAQTLASLRRFWVR